MPSLDSLSCTFKVTVNGSGGKNSQGADYAPLSEPLKINKSIGPFSKSIANAAALGADELYSAITVVASGGSADVSLASLTDILNQSGVSLARVKGYLIRLLSTNDDPTYGSTCTGITINGAGSNLAVLPGITDVTLGNGEFLAWATNSAAGIAVDGTHDTIHIVNNDAGQSAGVQITLIGGTT